MQYFRGRPACSCLIKWLPVYERELIDRGLLQVELDIWQLIGAASASANTHKTGGAADLGQFSDEQIRIARKMGAAACDRKPPVFSLRHNHLVLVGCPHAHPEAKAQVIELNAGGDGLRGDVPDYGPRAGLFPLCTYEDGIAWAKRNQRRRKLTTKIKAKRAEVVRLKRQISRLRIRREAV